MVNAVLIFFGVRYIRVYRLLFVLMIVLGGFVV